MKLRIHITEHLIIIINSSIITSGFNQQASSSSSLVNHCQHHDSTIKHHHHQPINQSVPTISLCIVSRIQAPPTTNTHHIILGFHWGLRYDTFVPPSHVSRIQVSPPTTIHPIYIKKKALILLGGSSKYSDASFKVKT